MEQRAEDEFDALVHDGATPPPAADRLAAGAAPTGSRLDDLLGRVPDRLRRHARWAMPTGVLAVAAATRFSGLNHPGTLVFDETYYVKDAWATWNLGYEANWPSDANDAWAAGDPNGYLTSGSFAVHPPLGKWIIGLFEWLGDPTNPYAWRLGTAIFGVLLVAAIMFAAWLLLKSIPWASLAGLLLAIDGNGIVMSRVGLLDVFVAFFALLAFIFILLDREWAARTGRLWWRPWLLAAGVALGADTACKWSGMWFVAAFGVFSVVADPNVRRGAGAFLARAGANLLLLIPIALAAYLVTWTGWFATDGGYDRHWADEGDNAWTGPLAWVPHPIQSWLHLEQAIYDYHVGEHRPHSYASPAWQWLLLLRPTSMYYQASSAGDPGCGSASCGASILDLPNPLIWYAAVAALVYLVIRLVRRREWQAGAVVLAFAAGYLPWLAYPERTIFEFYSIAFEPYLLLALVFAAKAVLGPPDAERSRRTTGWWLLLGFLGLAVLIGVYYWPLYTGLQAPYWFIASHWWLPGWL